MKKSKSKYKAAVAFIIVLTLLLSGVGMGADFKEETMKNDDDIDNNILDIKDNGRDLPDDGMIENTGSIDWWPMFSHDLGNTGFSTSDAPSTNNLLWSIKFGDDADQDGPEWTSLAIVDGRVFVPGLKIFHCLNESDGSIIWSFDSELGGGEFLYGSPTIVDNKVYFTGSNGRVYCRNASTGEHIWQHMIGFWLCAGATVVDGRAYVPCGDGYTYCLNASTGSEIWKQPMGGYGNCAVIDGRVFVSSKDGSIYCLNAVNGSEIWNQSIGESGESYAAPAVVDGKVYIGPKSDIFYCFDATTGSEIWSTTMDGRTDYTSPAVAYGNVYVYCEGVNEYDRLDSYLSCLNASTGFEIWNITMPSRAVSPAVADGKVFILETYKYSKASIIHGLNAFDGSVIWSYEFYGYSTVSPVIANGKLFVGNRRGENHVYCFGMFPGHDVGIYSIDSPMSEPFDIITPEVTVINPSMYNATDVPVNLQITQLSDGVVEYNETIVISVDSEKTLSVAFPGWTPADMGISGSVRYHVTACVLIDDDRPENDCKTEKIGLFSDIDWWPTFHHDTENIGYSTSSGPETNAILWSWEGEYPYTFGAYGKFEYTSPIVAEGRVYLCTENARITCLDAYSGSLIWRKDYGQQYLQDKLQSTPVVADGKVYFTCRRDLGPDRIEELYCLNASDGSEIWKISLSDIEYRAHLTIANGKIYVGDQCFNATDGSLIWDYYYIATIRSAPAVADGKVFISGNDGIFCLNATTGLKIWNKTINGSVQFSSPAVIDDRVYVGSEDYNVYCLNATDGSEIWSHPTYGPVTSSPAVVNGRVFIGSYDNFIHCLDASDGSEIWKFETEEYGVKRSSPAVADGKVYIGSLDGHFYCLDELSGSEIWNYWLSGEFYASPAVADGMVYACSKEDVFCFGLKDRDVGVTSIVSPVSGPNATFIPEVTVENLGRGNVTDIPVNMKIDKLVLDGSWIEILYTGTGHWEHADPEHWMAPLGGSGLFALADSYYNYPNIYDTGLFTPLLNLSGLSNVTLEFEMTYSPFSTDRGEVNAWSNGMIEENLATYTTYTWPGVHETLVFDPSGYSNPSEVYIEFYFTSGGEKQQGLFAIDDVSISEIGFSEDFESLIFPPRKVIPEYNQTVILENITSGENKTVTFPAWMPAGNDSIDYQIFASTQLSNDETPKNNYDFGLIILYFDGMPLKINNLMLTASEPLDTDASYGWENIACDITGTAIDVVQLNVTHNGTTTVEHQMANIPDTDTYYCNITLADEGCYDYHVWAKDIGGDQNISESQQFELPPNEDVDNNGHIYFMDLVKVVLKYNEHGPEGWVREDVDNNGHVYFMDLVKIVLRYNEHWAQC